MKAMAICAVAAAVAVASVFFGSVRAACGEEPIYIPDRRLELAVRDEIGVNTPLPIYPADMLRLDHLGVAGVTNLTGLDYAANLRVLSESGINWPPGWQGVTSIAPLSGLTKLESVHLSYDLGRGPITSLAPLAASKGMTSLSVIEYQVSDISALAAMNQMRHLRLDHNRVGDISALSAMPSLETLFLFGNQISDISSLSADVSIKDLRIYANQVKSIEAVAGMTSLDELWASFNQIEDISPVRGASAVTFLDFDNNKVNYLPDLSCLPNLRLLALGFNQLTEIRNAASLSSVQELYLNNNAIIDISSLASLHNLQQLDLRGNPLNAEAYSTWIPLIIENNPGLFYFKYDPLPEPATGVVLLTGLTLWQMGPRRRRGAPPQALGILHEGVCDVEEQRTVGGLRCGILYGHVPCRGLHLGGHLGQLD